MVSRTAKGKPGILEETHKTVGFHRLPQSHRICRVMIHSRQHSPASL